MRGAGYNASGGASPQVINGYCNVMRDIFGEVRTMRRRRPAPSLSTVLTKGLLSNPLPYQIRRVQRCGGRGRFTVANGC